MSTRLIGSDGDVTTPDGYKAALNTFSCTLTRASTVTTGFGDTSARRRLSNVLDITGSAGGVPSKDAADASPLGITGTGISGSGTDAVALTLTFATGCTIALDAVVNSVALSAAQDGDQTVTFNFEMADSNGPTVNWDES